MKDTKIAKHIGETLKKHRLKNGYTQEQVAELMDLAPKYISQIERGISAGTIDTLIRFCNLYNITTDAVLYPFLNSSIKSSNQKYNNDFKKLCLRDQKAVENLIQYYLNN